MDRAQYEFSNVFWSDEEWDKKEGIPKYFTIDENGVIEFHFLNEEETKEFFKIKMREEPELLLKSRKKKLKKI